VLPEIGTLLGGRYTIERRVGEGGMAVVYEAKTPEGDRVALKILKPDFAKSPDVVTRFKREARAVRKLRSPHAVRVMDVATTPEGLPYMVMEFLVGRDLSQELEKLGPLPIADAVGYMVQACVAMREAHHRGIVHRDLKPDNLFLVQEHGDTVVKVLDFGISKIQGELGDMTSTQAVMGTAYYMSPEQVRAVKNADARSDLWSLGVILYEILTGKVPYDGNGNAGYVMVSICIEPLPSMREARPEISPELERAILRALEKDREKRVQTAEELIRELASATGLPMPPLEALEPLGSQPEISVSAVVYQHPPQIRKSPAPLPWPWLAAGAAALMGFLMIGIAVAVVLHKQPDAKQVPSASTTSAPPRTSTELPILATASATPSASVALSASAPAPSAPPQTTKPATTSTIPNVLSRRR
jgi:serine/threonine-protein kinase